MSRSLSATIGKLYHNLELQDLVPGGLEPAAAFAFGLVDKQGRAVISVSAAGVVSFPLSGATAASDTTITGTLTATGATALGSTLAVTGNVAVNTDKFTIAASSGNTAIAGTLAVTGASTLTGNVTASGTLAVTGASTLTGNVSCGGTLAVTGASTLTGALAVASSIKSSHATAGIGYATGAGATVTQGTSRTTGVTINAACGTITLVSAAGSATPFSFTVTNSAVAATDTVRICQKSGTDKYTTQQITAVGAGSFEVTLANASGTTTEQPAFNFAVIKGVAA